MRYRVCKMFEVETGHMLSKHPGRCRFPHGHSRRVEIVLSSDSLDANDMVCDFKALKLAVTEYLDAFDHALAVNAADPELARLRAGPSGGRLVIFEGEDPTTEVLARRIYDHVDAKVREGGVYQDDEGNSFSLRKGVTVERVRVGETSSSWAEYGI